jgi:hypothetical protein
MGRLKFRCVVGFTLAIASIQCLILAAGPGDVIQPANRKKKPYTAHDYRDQLLAYNRETLSVAYKKVGKHGAWDADAVKFLDEMAKYFTSAGLNWVYRADFDPKPHGKLINAGNALLVAGCDDPLVVYCYGVVLHDNNTPQEALGHVRFAVEGLESAGYPSARVAAAAGRLTRLDPSTLAQMRPVIQTHRVKMCSGKLDDIRRRYFAYSIWDDFRDNRDEQSAFVEQLRNQADADPWLLNLFEGRLHIRLAWDSRGSGWANTVTEEGWRGFHEHLEKARDSLTAAYKLAPQLPEPCVNMITVAMGAGEDLDEDEMTWFERAEAAQLDNSDMYSCMYNALLPRWGGSHAAIYDLGLRGARTERFDTVAPWQLVNAVEAIVRDAGGAWQPILARPGVSEALCDVAERYATHAKKIGNGESEAWNITYCAAVLWRAGKYAEARKYLEKVGDRADPKAFTRLGSKDPPAAMGHAYAMASPQAADVEAAEAHLSARRFDKALEAFWAMQAKADPRAKPYLDARIKLVDRKVRFGKGEWVDIQPGKDIEGWTFVSGTWTVDDKGKLLAETTNRVNPTLVFNDPLGPRVELSGSMQPWGPRGGHPGVVIAENSKPVYYVYVGRGFLTVSGKDGKTQRIDHADLANIHGSLPFVAAYDKGKLSLSVNGKPVLNGHRLPVGLLQNAQIGLTISGSAKFSDLKVRRIVDTPAGDGLE